MTREKMTIEQRRNSLYKTLMKLDAGSQHYGKCAWREMIRARVINRLNQLDALAASDTENHRQGA